MFRRILIPTDFSTASEWAFDEAVHIAAASGAELLILHVRMTRSSHPGELRFPADPSLYEYAEQQELQRLRDRVRRAHASLETRLIVRQGPDPAAEIRATALQEGTDLIVIATHARHHVAHLIVGSTTMSLLHDPPAPVLVVRYGTTKRTSLSRALVPVRVGETSTPALDLASKASRDVHLVIPFQESEKSLADTLIARLAAAVPNGVARLLPGSDATREIVRYATRVNADVVYLDAGADLDEARLDVLRYSPAPVMIVPGSSVNG
jgi:nucleotide-binding universal stress UspA family protein